jgi:hypothetical protein
VYTFSIAISLRLVARVERFELVELVERVDPHEAHHWENH